MKLFFNFSTVAGIFISILSMLYLVKINSIFNDSAKHGFSILLNENIQDQNAVKIESINQEGLMAYTDGTMQMRWRNGMLLLRHFSVKHHSHNWNADIFFSPTAGVVEQFIRTNHYDKNNIYQWTNNLFVITDVVGFYDIYINNIKETSYCLGVIYMLILGMAGWCLVLNLKEKHIFSGKFIFCIVIISGSIPISFILSQEWLLINIPSLNDSEIIAINNQTNKLLQSSTSTNFINLNEAMKLKTNHIKNAFVAKPPIIPIEYVRYNINPLVYIFAGRNLTDPTLINKAMTYCKIGNNVWLGQYDDLIKKTQEFNRFRYKYIFAWLLFSGGFLWFAWWIRRRHPIFTEEKAQ